MGTGEKAKVEEPLPALDLDVVAENNDTRMTVADEERCRLCDTALSENVSFICVGCFEQWHAGSLDAATTEFLRRTDAERRRTGFFLGPRWGPRPLGAQAPSPAPPPARRQPPSGADERDPCPCLFVSSLLLLGLWALTVPHAEIGLRVTVIILGAFAVLSGQCLKSYYSYYRN